jgi:NTE family protein
VLVDSAGDTEDGPTRVGLVLGAGGVLGGAWLTGALHALATETEWDPGGADYIVGTSAGALIGSLTAAGVPAWFMVAHSAGESFEGLAGPDGRAAADADRSGGASFRLERGLPALGPGSLRMAATTLVRPMRHTPLQLLAGWLPQGLVSTDSIKDTVRRAVPSGWVGHRSFWAVATDYRSGRRVPFGRLGAPPAELPDAVAASCAIPGFFRPVTIGGRPYVDGGVCSPSNLDLLAGKGLDLVICLNPTSTLHRARLLNPLDLVAGASRDASGRRLGYEARKVRARGTEVVLVQPVEEDLAVMGPNLMRGERRHEVIELAIRTVSKQLREPQLRIKLAGLPKGEPYKIRRPEGHPSSWPKLVPGAPARRAA